MAGHESKVTGASVVTPFATAFGSSDMRDAALEESNGPRVAELVQLHYDFVWRVLRRLGVMDAEDAAQQVFLVASRKLASIEAGRERAFLMGAAVRVALDYRRTVRRRRETGEDPPDVASAAPTPEDLLDRRRARELLDQILDRLTPELREAFVLYEIEELETPEIAKLLEIPVGTVASRLRRAREAFNEHISRWQRSGPERSPR